ncbi:MAG TPA: DUF1203 domain-containing protein, partial [Pyrinomonadaceae bacterium]|nr:DUF1203 domain-containing protein [Pyrinomonadaceae bacterium]
EPLRAGAKLMHSDFQFVAVPVERFAHLFSMDDAELASSGARRMTVAENPGYPCRVSLMDAPIGETVILTPFQHHDVNSPYQSAGPIFVREAAQTAKPEVNEIPLMLHHRLLSVRAFNEDAIMKAARVVEGKVLQETINDFFTNSGIAYLHVHNAAPGCFNCLVQRANEGGNNPSQE